SRIRKVPFVFEVRDLWPAIFVELGILQHPFLIKILELLEMFLYSNADLIVTVTNSFRDRLIERGIESGKIIVIFNGAMVSIYRPGSKDRALVEELSLEDKFVVSYIGSHGISQGVNTIVNAAEILRLRSNIDFLLVGDGAMKKSIGQTIIDKKLSNVKMLPPQSKDLIPDFYRISDVCIVPLKNISLFDSFVPSKIFEIMACGIPIIASVVGEAKEILQRSQSAKIISPESAVELVTAIEWMFDNHQERSKMAESGRMFVCDHYDRSILAKNYMNHLRSIVL
ncbi:MAG TPA: glycosyltransferase WbuB, partial [Chloroflexi bacterium]|nr:glycosyltransferase WbuB [Chloroflexota bacterium]